MARSLRLEYPYGILSSAFPLTEELRVREIGGNAITTPGARSPGAVNDRPGVGRWSFVGYTTLRPKRFLR